MIHLTMADAVEPMTLKDFLGAPNNQEYLFSF